MFQAPFSFSGRIRRSEYLISSIIFVFAYGIIITIIDNSHGGADILGLLIIPLLWFSFAQRAKRCHDLGNSGWWQLVPFYGFLLLFQKGDLGANQYGPDPKGLISSAIPTPVRQSGNTSSTNNGGQNSGQNNGYGGGYSGGHNATQSFPNSSNKPNPGGTEYQGGNPYN